jgi:hypothetical protein
MLPKNRGEVNRVFGGIHPFSKGDAPEALSVNNRQWNIGETDAE